MNAYKLGLFTCIVFLLSSFSRISEVDFIGTYGVSDNDPSNIELVLNADKSFTYQDASVASNKIQVRGKWEVKNNHIYLNSHEKGQEFHSKWKIVNDGMVAKSRKGLTFYRLIKK